jgi:glycosyltransferase involved in cell wall biosynthesis
VSRPAGDCRLLVISRYFPPMVGGSAILMGNLLASFPREQLHVIRGRPGVNLEDAEFTVDIPQTCVEMPKALGRYGWRLSHLLYPAVLAAAYREHRRRPFTAVLGCWPLACDLDFAYRIHKRFGIPLYLYMHDQWSDLARSPLGKRLTRMLEQHYVRAATKVFCITDAAARQYREMYGVETHTLWHSVNWASVPDQGVFVEPAADRRDIVFCGAIYELMNHDSVVRINEAVQSMPGAQMIVCTQNPGPPASLGLRGGNLSMFSASRAEAFRQVQSASVVCAPLAFHSYARDEVRTVYPTKMLDYLVCGRPILVHAPADSFLARDARERGWGWVVDRPDVSAVREGLESVASDVPLQRRLVTAAWQEARRRDSRLIAADLYRQVQTA